MRHKTSKIDLLNFTSPQMRAFHKSWFAFFLCILAWFGIAPLMAIVRDEFGLTKEQIGNTIIASVSMTILFRLFFGWLSDRIGPRLSYTWLLCLGSIPVMSIGLANNYESFLIFRLLIGVIGASFVITQHHTSLMFASNIVGTANATTAGWGNLGGGATQIAMPLLLTLFVGFGFGTAVSWRLAMFGAGLLCFLMGIAYYFLTQDTPEGNFSDLRKAGKMPQLKKSKGNFLLACKDHRVWSLFLIYGACFGVELSINNIAVLYFMDYFSLDLKTAGLIAASFGLMNIFARSLGGILSDKFNLKSGLTGRVRWLFLALLFEGIFLVVFSQMSSISLAIFTLIIFSLFVQMSNGATFSIVPFINKKALGSVAGIVGAGGNFGAVAAGFLFKHQDLSWPDALMFLGVAVILISFCTFIDKFNEEESQEEILEAGPTPLGANKS